MPAVRNIVFDCNESILDLTTITPVFQRLFGASGAMRLWFQDLIIYSQALTTAGVYVPFTDIGGAVLEKIAASRGVKITVADRTELTDRFATMPPYPEVPGALRRLKAAGFHLFTLTDNTAAISGRQLTHGGLIDSLIADLASTTRPSGTNRLQRPMPRSPWRLARRPRKCAWSPATRGTLSEPRQSGGKPGLLSASTTMSWITPHSPSTWETISTPSPIR
jgi:2-haloalkanoic acid dehalogenase type II